MLSFDFDVVGESTAGEDALEVSSRLDPDIVVLDITMPGLNGFETARELERRGSRARPMFLTMHDSQEFVVEGFRSGGWGYVVKTRVHEDLVRAIYRVMAGQLFVPSLESLAQITDERCEHAAQFYADDVAFIEGISTLTDTVLRRGDVVTLVAREVIRQGVAEQLCARGWNAVASGTQGRYQASDSDDALASVMSGSCVDGDRVERVVEGLEQMRVAHGSERRMTLVGEISVPLFESGNVEAGLALERHWNAFTQDLPFLTVCCYPAAYFDAQRAHVYPQVCAEHWAIV
jgi:DNA-binding NarL/FixJ family response regulator